MVRVQTSSQDYDNLVPAVTLRFVMEQISMDDQSNIHYPDYKASYSACSGNEVKDRHGRDVLCGHVSGDPSSSNYYKSENSGTFHTDIVHTAVKGVLSCEAAVKNNRTMGNFLFGLDDASASEAQPASAVSENDKKTSNSGFSDQETNSEFEIKNVSTDSVCDKPEFDTQLAHTSGVSLNTATSELERHETSTGTYDCAFTAGTEALVSPTEDLESFTEDLESFTGDHIKTISDKERLTRDYHATENSPSSGIVGERSSNTTLALTNTVSITETERQSSSEKKFSTSCPLEHNFYELPGAAAIQTSFCGDSAQRSRSETLTVTHSVKAATKTNDDKVAPSGDDMLPTDGEAASVTSVAAPAIIITPSTPQNKPLTSSKSSANSSDCNAKKKTEVSISELVRKETKGKEKANVKQNGRSERNFILSSCGQNVSVHSKTSARQTVKSVSVEDTMFLPPPEKTDSTNTSENSNRNEVASSLTSKSSVHKNDGPVYEFVKSDNVETHDKSASLLTNDISPECDTTQVKEKNGDILTVADKIFAEETRLSPMPTKSELNNSADEQSSLVFIERGIQRQEEENTWGDYAELSEGSFETSVTTSLNERDPHGGSPKSQNFSYKEEATVGTRAFIGHNKTTMAKPETKILLGSYYRAVTGTNGNINNKNKMVNMSIEREITQGKLLRTQRPLHHRIVLVGTDNEAEYAIPIPKSQRKIVSSRPRQKSEQEDDDVPSRPPRSPTTNARQLQDDDDRPETAVVSNKVQMKKSTTFGVLRSISDQYDYSNVPKFGRYDCFSLGRRPKCSVSNTLRDNRGMAVSLDILLKLRKQNPSDVSNTAATVQTLSVDDILRSCSEFQQSDACYRSRTNSDSVPRSFLHSLSFMEAANSEDQISNSKQTDMCVTHSRSHRSKQILKKCTREENESRPGLNTDHYHVNTSGVQETRTDDVKRKKQYVNRGSKEQHVNSGSKEQHVSSLSKEQHVNSLSKEQHMNSLSKDQHVNSLSKEQYVNSLSKEQHVNSLSKEQHVNNGSNATFSESKELQVSLQIHAGATPIVTTVRAEKIKQEDQFQLSEKIHLVSLESTPITRTLENVKPADCPDLQNSSENHVTGKKMANVDSLTSQEQSKIQARYHAQNSDYDVAVVHDGKMETLSLVQKNNPIVPDYNNADIYKNIHSPKTAALAFATQPVNPSLERQKIPETVSSTPSKTRPQKVPTQTLRPSITAKYPSDSVSSHVMSYTSEITLSGAHPQEISSFSSEARTHLSPVSVSSDSAQDSSSEVMSSLTVDVFTDTGVGDSLSPVQRSQECQAKLEATEAVKWLRAAGFPQYTQMFDDGQFPVDLRDVEKDHDFLDKDSLVSLFRRLETLNKYAGIKLDVLPCKKGTNEEEEEDDTCALSDHWEYQNSSRRWSRKNLVHPSKESTAMGSDQKELESRSCSHDSLLADQESESQTDDSPRQETKVPHIQDIDNHDGRTVVEIKLKDEGQNSATVSPFLSHTGSDRIKSPKNIFSRMEGLKSKKSRRQSSRRNIMEISGPIVADSEIMQARLKKLNCVDITPTSETLHRSPAKGAKADGEVCSDLSVDKYDSKASSGITVTESSIGSPQSAVSTKSFSESVPRLNEANYPQFSHVNHTRLGLSTKYTESKDRSSVHYLPLDQDSSLIEHSQTSCATNQQTHREEISTDMSLADVLLAAQDYHHGRFPREHQNGHVEREACGTAFGSDNTRVSSGVNVAEDHKASSYVINSSDVHCLEHRKSLYDNILSVDDQSMEEGEFRMIFPGIFKLESGENRIQSLEVRSDLKVNSATVEMTKHRLAGDFVVEHGHKNSANISYDSSAASTPGRNLDKRHTSLIMGKSVKFDTTSSSPIPRRSRSPCSTGISSGDPKNGGISGPGSTGLSRHHDHSPDFVASGSGHEPSRKDCPENMPEISLQQDYDDFDRILQQLYQNINDLASFMDEDKPAQQELPHDNSDSLDFDATLDLDQENSFSGGEGSNTAESSSEDQEFGLTDLSQDDGLDQISEISMERRDSGVGHSLTRSSRDQRRKKIRWHSFQKSHRPDINCRAMQINSLSVAQLVRLQKLSLLKLTSIMEKCLPVSKSGWNWMMPRFMKRQRTPDFSTKNVFGVPLTLMAQWTGQPLPQCVLYAMRYLRRTSPHAVGIFRKSGVKSKIQQLRDELEAHPDITNFEGVNAYNVADMLKTYFRDLPECLLTNKMSEIFCSIYMHVPQSQRLEAIQTAIALLPDVNREVLQSILLFLSDISSHEAEHQMNASNLAVCFTPTVFQLGARQNAAYSPKRNHKTSPGVPDPREIMEQKAAHECLLMMITECKKLFTVPLSLFLQLQVQSVSHITPTPLQDIGSSPSDIRAFGQERIQIILKEAHDKNRGWLPTLIFGDVEVFHRKPIDDCPLKEWKLTVDIEAPPIEVLHRIMHERHVWDEDLLNWSVVERLDPHADIFQFVLNSMAPHPSRHFCILRYWRSDLNKGACALITQSVDRIDAMEAQGVTAVDLGTYFLMEPCGSGRSRLTYVTRVDMRGRTPEWYTKIYSHICINFLKRLKESFRQYTSGPETRV